MPWVRRHGVLTRIPVSIRRTSAEVTAPACRVVATRTVANDLGGYVRRARLPHGLSLATPDADAHERRRSVLQYTRATPPVRGVSARGCLLPLRPGTLTD